METQLRTPVSCSWACWEAADDGSKYSGPTHTGKLDGAPGSYLQTDRPSPSCCRHCGSEPVNETSCLSAFQINNFSRDRSYALPQLSQLRSAYELRSIYLPKPHPLAISHSDSCETQVLSWPPAALCRGSCHMQTPARCLSGTAHSYVAFLLWLCLSTPGSALQLCGCGHSQSVP